MSQPQQHIPSEPAKSSNEADKTPWFSFTWDEFIYHPIKRFQRDQAAIEAVKAMQDNPNETGMDRITQSWNAYKNGEDSLEINLITNSMGMAGLSGFVFGGMANSQESMKEFIRQHNANIYQGKYQANRALADKIYINFFRRGLRQAVKYSLFSGLFVGSLTMSAIYRNDLRFADCAFCGALTGTLWKIQLGPRAMFVNAVVGSLFGITFAGIMKLSMKLLNTSIREMRYYHQAVNDSKNKTWAAAQPSLSSSPHS